MWTSVCRRNHPAHVMILAQCLFLDVHSPQSPLPWLLQPLSHHKERPSLTVVVPAYPFKIQISWHSSSMPLTHTSYERLKGTHVPPLHMKRVCKCFQCYFFYPRGMEIKLSQTVFQDLRKRAQGYFVPCLG